MASETMRDRWVAFMAELGFTGPVLAQDAVKAAMPFAESELRRAQQPAAPSAELAEAEEWLRQQWGPHGQKLASAIAAALDSLRAENNQLRLDVAAVTEDFQQLARECDALREERDRLKLFEPRFHAALMDLSDVVQGALTRDRISDPTTAASLSQAIERASKVLDGGDVDQAGKAGA